MNAVHFRQLLQGLVVEEKRAAILVPLHPRIGHQGRNERRLRIRLLQTLERIGRHGLIASCPVHTRRVGRSGKFGELAVLFGCLVELARAVQRIGQHAARVAIVRFRCNRFLQRRHGLLRLIQRQPRGTQ